MTSKERILAAIRSQDIDYTPMIVDFSNPYARDNIEVPPHPGTDWENERARLEIYKKWGWDTYLTIVPHVTPLPEVKTSVAYDVEAKVLKQTWKTPSGEIREQLKLTPDWPEANGRQEPVPFNSDFRTARYLEYPFKDKSSLATLPYLFPEINDVDNETITREFEEMKTLAEEFQVPLFVYLDAGMDWLTWLYPLEEAIITLMDKPEQTPLLLEQINRAKYNRLKTLLSLGADGVIRRGWYESADYWSPVIFNEFAAGALNAEIRITREAGAVYVYLMMTGIMPILGELKKLNFDCLAGAEPELGGQDLEVIRAQLNKSIWGGISAPRHMIEGTPEIATAATHKAFDIIGRKGLILSPTVIFRRTWPWENLMAMERTWRERR